KGHSISDGRGAIEQHEDEAAHRVDVRVLEIDAELLAHLLEPRHAEGAQLVVRFEDGLNGGGAIGDLADDLLEEIFDGDDTGSAAVFVHHDDELRLLPTHPREHCVQLGGLRHEGDGADDVSGERASFDEETEQIPDEHDADDLIERPVVDRVTRVPAAADGSPEL